LKDKALEVLPSLAIDKPEGRWGRERLGAFLALRIQDYTYWSEVVDSQVLLVVPKAIR